MLYALGNGSSVKKDLATSNIGEISNMAKSMVRGDLLKKAGVETEQQLLDFAKKAFEEGVQNGPVKVGDYGSTIVKQIVLESGDKANISFLTRKGSDALPEMTTVNIAGQEATKLTNQTVKYLKQKARDLGNPNL